MVNKKQEHKVQDAKDNYDKCLTYQVCNEKIKIALKSECYLEIAVIQYAECEDMLRAIFYYLGLINEINDNKYTSLTKDLVEKFVNDDAEDHNDNYKIGKFYNIVTKIRVLRGMFSHYNDSKYKNNMYCKCLREFVEERSIDTKRFVDILNQLEIWKDVRNEFIHRLMNKNIFDVEEKVKVAFPQGEHCVKELHKIYSKVKYKNYMRAKIKI